MADCAHSFIYITASSYRKAPYWYCSKCGKIEDQAAAGFDSSRFIGELERHLKKVERPHTDNFVTPIFAGMLKIVIASAKAAVVPAMVFESAGQSHRTDPVSYKQGKDDNG